MVIKIFFKEMGEDTRKALGFRWLTFYGKQKDYFETTLVPGLKLYVSDAGQLYLHCVTNVFLTPELGPLKEYVDSYLAEFYPTSDGLERAKGRYEYKTAKGRYTGSGFYMGGPQLEDIIEFIEILSEGKILPKKEYPKQSLTRAQIIASYLNDLGSISWIKSFLIAFRLANVHKEKRLVVGKDIKIPMQKFS